MMPYVPDNATPHVFTLGDEPRLIQSTAKYLSGLVKIQPFTYQSGQQGFSLLDNRDSSNFLIATAVHPNIKPRKDEVFIKDWHENEGVFQTLIDNGVVFDTRNRVAMPRGLDLKVGRIASPAVYHSMLGLLRQEPQRRVVYTLPKIFYALQLEGLPRLEIPLWYFDNLESLGHGWLDHDRHVYSLHYSDLNYEQLLSVPGIDRTVWKFQDYTGDGRSVFKIDSTDIRLSTVFDVGQYDEITKRNLWCIRPKGFPLEK